MRIPLSLEALRARSELEQLGFDWSTLIEPEEGLPTLEVPDISELVCDVKEEDFDRHQYLLRYNNILVLDIRCKSASYDSWATVKVMNISEALAAEPVSEEEKIKPRELTEYQERLEDRLRQIHFILTGPDIGASSWLPSQIQMAEELKRENLREFKELFELKPMYAYLLKYKEFRISESEEQEIAKALNETVHEEAASSVSAAAPSATSSAMYSSTASTETSTAATTDENTAQTSSSECVIS